MIGEIVFHSLVAIVFFVCLDVIYDKLIVIESKLDKILEEMKNG